MGCGRNERGWEGCATPGEQEFPQLLTGGTDFGPAVPVFSVRGCSRY